MHCSGRIKTYYELYYELYTSDILGIIFSCMCIIFCPKKHRRMLLNVKSGSRNLSGNIFISSLKLFCATENLRANLAALPYHNTRGRNVIRDCITFM